MPCFSGRAPDSHCLQHLPFSHPLPFTRSPPQLTGTLSGVPLVVPRRLRQGNTMTIHMLFICTHFVSHEILSSFILLIMLTFVQKSRRPCYLLILGSTTLYRGAQIVTLVMPIRYLQPIPFLDTRLDNSRCFSNPSRRHTSSTSSFLCQCRHGLGIHRLGSYKRRGSSTFTFYIFESHITFHLLQGQSQEVGHLFGCVGPEMRASRHIITSTRAIYQHQSAILHLLCRNYDFRTKKTKKTMKKLKK